VRLQNGLALYITGGAAGTNPAICSRRLNLFFD